MSSSPQYATCASIGMAMKGDPDVVAKYETAINTYLQRFTDAERCPKCDRLLGGLLGTFQWGLAHGEGNCSECGWPCRAYHRVTLEDGAKVSWETILPYHPDCVTVRAAQEEAQG